MIPNHQNNNAKGYAHAKHLYYILHIEGDHENKTE